MSEESVRKYLGKRGFEDRIDHHMESIDTVAHAALQIGCSEAEIAKTLSFLVEGSPILIVMAGDARVSNPKFKSKFGTKPSMIPRELVKELVGHEIGGVCPFAIKEGVPVWLDISLKRFSLLHPAGGSEYTSVRLSPSELEEACDAAGWCDVSKD